MTVNLKKLWKSEYFQTIIIICLIAVVVFGFWYGLQVVLNTPYPALAVVSGSMCIPYNGACAGWSHPFSRTLHIGDLIIVQGVSPADLNADYPNSDIIVFHKPNNPSELIVHRIVAKEERAGILYLYTKGDGNGANKWPIPPTTSDYDPWNNGQGIPENLVVGKVIMRIPWLGHVVMLMKSFVGLYMVIALLIILVIVEFIFPLIRGRASPKQQQATQQQS